jgi:hypothetical protein
MKVARGVAERVHAAEREARIIVRHVLDRIRQPVAVHPVEIALVDRITARPCRNVVEVDELLRHVELVTQRDRTPVAFQADISLPAELRTTESILAVA